MPEGDPCGLYTVVGGRALSWPGCPLWIVDTGRFGCALAGVQAELTGSPGLAYHLLELRLALERARTSDECTNARSLFSRRVNEEQAAEA